MPWKGSFWCLELCLYGIATSWSLRSDLQCSTLPVSPSSPRSLGRPPPPGRCWRQPGCDDRLTRGSTAGRDSSWRSWSSSSPPAASPTPRRGWSPASPRSQAPSRTRPGHPRSPSAGRPPGPCWQHSTGCGGDILTTGRNKTTSCFSSDKRLSDSDSWDWVLRLQGAEIELESIACMCLNAHCRIKCMRWPQIRIWHAQISIRSNSFHIKVAGVVTYYETVR